MTEPTTGASLAMLTTGVAVSLLPFINADALIGAAFGAAVITTYTTNVVWYQKIIGLILSIIGGYIFGGAVLDIFPIFKSLTLASCIASIICVPFVIKVSSWFSNFDLGALINSCINGFVSKWRKKDEDGKE